MPLLGLGSAKAAVLATRIAANKKLRIVYLRGLTELILQTPVDTGRARSNWFLTSASPSDEVTESNRNSLSISLREMPRVVLDNRIFLTNNLPYINALEFGHSKQAPSGWVRATLLKMKNEIVTV